MIFRYTDTDGDCLEVHSISDRLVFRSVDSDVDHATVAVSLPREELERLYNAIGERLFPQDLGPNPGDYATAVKALSDAINGLATSVRPLWSGPRAACGCIGEGHPTSSPVEQDPEPREVGHPEPSAPCTRPRPSFYRPEYTCIECGYLWTEHAVTPVPEDHGRLMSELPRRVRPKVGCECGHAWDVHSLQARIGCFAAPGGDVCECRCTRPSASTVGCTCDHKYAYVHDSNGCTHLPCECKFTRR